MEASVWVYLLLTAVTVGLALLVDNREYVQYHISGRMPWGCERQKARNLAAEIGIYGFLAGVSACRIAVGNDYWVYAENFRLIAQGRYVSYEPGFNLVVKWMQDLFGYNHYLPIFGLFSLLTVFFFLKALHDQGRWYAASLYLLLTGGYYFSSMNNVRYYFVLAIALYSMKYVLRGEYGKFVLWILGAALFHKSVLLVIPVYLVAKWLAGIRLQKWHYAAGIGFVLSLLLCPDFYRKIIFFFYPFYENSAFDTGETSIINIGKCLATLILALICYGRGVRDDENNRFYFFLNLGGLVVYSCASFIPEVSRVAYYMVIGQIFLIPNLLMSMKPGWMKKFCILGTGAAFFVYFMVFLYKAQDTGVRLLPYYNWIFD